MTHVMAVINHEGDTRVEWDPDVEHEVEAARRMWRSLVSGKGYSAFSVRSDGSAGERVREFDPEHEKLILVPPLQGGQR
jgi:hypothetical protein